MVIPFALPPCEPGGPDPAGVVASIGEWVTSPELAELVVHFGGEVPDGPIGSVLARLAEFSRVWDFRGGVKERFDTERVDYEGDVDARLRLLISVLGLGGSDRPVRESYDHIIVLGGGIRVTLGRTDYTARLLAKGLRARTLAGLASLRWRHDREHRESVRLGLGPIETEADMMSVGLCRAMDLARPTSERGGDGWWHRVWADPRPGVAEVHVLAAPSTRPPQRANTADTLIGWAEYVSAPTAADRVLLVTNDPYVRYQHCDAIRLLGMRYGCGIETVGFDDLATREWGRPLSTTELLQEVRSSLLAARNLHDALVPPR
ncbi:hypothetical protein GCM10023322_58580 [Rugosimonospora acidiphila]|uniref:Uncharacterized protein n=1 Tax=Rugosimonospora acidiphila TaxID=556531 RepID=A0ABP9SG84_9ACTN